MKTYHSFRLLGALDREGKDWEVCIIEVGQSKNSKDGLPIYYDAEVLKQAAPLYENAKACIYDFDRIKKHLPDAIQNAVPEGFPKSVVGWYDNVRFGEFQKGDGKTGEGLLAHFHVSENAKWLRELLKDAWEHGKSLLGFSHDAKGRMSPATIFGRAVNAVKKILEINSVDVVTHPAAGGSLLRLVAAEEIENGGANEMDYLKKLLEFLAVKSPDAVEGVDPDNITEEQEMDLLEAAFKADEEGTMALLQEQVGLAALVAKLAGLVKGNAKALAVVKQIQALLKKYPRYAYPKAVKASEDDEAKAKADAEAKAKADAEAKAKADASKSDAEKTNEAVAKVEKVQENILKMNCKALLEGELKSCNLPVPIQESLKKRFANRIFEAKELEGAMNEQRDILAKLQESGEVRGLGGRSDVEVTLEEADKLQAACDKMIDPEAEVPEKCKGVGAFRGLKEAYAVITGDRDVTGKLPEGRIKEAMSSSDIANILGTSITRRLVKLYAVLPSTWRNVANVVRVSDFKTQEAVRWGGFGRLPVVAERGSYTDLYGASDEKATYAATKKGGLVSITREMIKNDDLKALARIPREVARAANETVEYYVWNPIIANSTIYDLTALATVAHANYATGALDYSTLTDAKTRMRKQWSRGSKQESGTALGSHSTTTLQDTSKSWTTNAYAGKYVRLLSGTGAGAISLIASNTADTLTFAAVPTAPVDTTAYEISVASATDPRIGLEPKFWVGSVDLKPSAVVLKDSILKPGSANNDINVHKGSFEILVPLWWSDVTDWALIADKAVIDIVEIGFVDGQETPQLFRQDVPTVGNVFTNDEIRLKVRHEYGVVMVDYRGVDLSVVAG